MDNNDTIMYIEITFVVIFYYDDLLYSRRKMETSVCNTFFMSGIKEFKKEEGGIRSLRA